MQFIQHQDNMDASNLHDLEVLDASQLVTHIQESYQRMGIRNFNLSDFISLSLEDYEQEVENEAMKAYYKQDNNIELNNSINKQSAKAYFCLRKLGVDQTLWFSGLNISYFQSIEQLLFLSSSNKNTSISDKVHHVQTVLSMIDKTQTNFMLHQMQLNNKGKLAGFNLQLINYELVSDFQYWIFSGYGNPNEIKHLLNLDQHAFNHDFKVHFFHFKEALIHLGLNDYLDTIFDMLLIGFYLNYLIFEDNDYNESNITNPHLVDKICELMQVDGDVFRNFILTKNQLNDHHQNVTSLLNAQQCKSRAINLSKLFINNTIQFIVYKINHNTMCDTQYSNHINFINLNYSNNNNIQDINTFINEFSKLNFIDMFSKDVNTHNNNEKSFNLYKSIMEVIENNTNKDINLISELSKRCGLQMNTNQPNTFQMNTINGNNLDLDCNTYLHQNYLDLDDMLAFIKIMNINFKSVNYLARNAKLLKLEQAKWDLNSYISNQFIIDLFDKLKPCLNWYHFKLDFNILQSQLYNFNLNNIHHNLFNITISNDEFYQRYNILMPNENINDLQLYINKDYIEDNDNIYLTYITFYNLEYLLKYSNNNNIQPFIHQHTNKSIPISEKEEGSKINLIQPKKIEKDVKVVELTFVRKMWVRLTWLMTWWIPTFLIARRMKRPDVQMAWREKVTICLLVALSWLIILFVNIGLGLILCPPDKVWLPSEIKTLQGPDDLGVYMYGVVYDITDFSQQRHGKSINPAGVDPDTMYQFGGQDVTSSFPIPLYISCSDYVQDQNFKLWTNTSDDTLTSQYFVHDSGPLTQYPATSLKDPLWFTNTALPKLKKLKKGEVAYDFKMLSDYRKAGYKQWGIINNKVYDLTPYIQTLNQPQFQTNTPGAPKADFLPNTINQMFSNDSPAKDADLTDLFNKKSGLNADEKKKVLKCLDNTFYIGKLDPRTSLRCQLTNILLLVSSGIILLVTLVKFLAALQLTSKRIPMDYDKFVICQVPCYTEGEDSIRRTLESLALLNYDDKHKLIFIICDGMIIGSGNDKPTPKIVLDVLGVDPELEPESFCYNSIGDGSKQLNYAKVYSGLYMADGRSVPYLVVSKVGKPNEKSKPGNRGKRDSQILLMNFLNRTHFDAPMTPLDLEIYHQLKNVIGVDPNLYEYILMVDADTEVMQDSLTRLIAVMTRDAKVIGLCGETCLSNENQSITTMMQVYEYYISHNLAKAFESLFGAVTCLPGCFCMYRIKTLRNQPLIISNQVIKDYSENIVDTLHKKNLLHLGEDRYLTTLMLKHFPTYKMKYTPDAQCKTVAPERFEVLLSQRRRWINSTIHNLFELVFLNEMCGFCCFSMRFVVFLDLVGTLILPATVIYLIYIIAAAATGFQYIGTYSIIIMCSAYILQALIFIIKQQWQHIGWMVFYLLGMGLFNFYIPIYSFWHFDDFSWGNTRVVLNDDGKKQIINEEEETFDPESIPYIKWSEYEQQLWENQTSYSGVPNIQDKFIRDSQMFNLNRESNIYPMHSTEHFPTREVALSYYDDHSRVSSPFTTINQNQYEMQTMNMDDEQLNELLFMELKNIMDHENLMNLSKKNIRLMLQNKFPNVNMEAKKEWLSAMIDKLISKN